jgi:adenosylcobinamide-GDP ribazoletransferase
MSVRRMGLLGGAFAATVFLTRVRLPQRLYQGPHAWRWAVPWFPVVGGAIGVVLAGIWHWSGPLHPLPAAVIVVIASMLLTGALHEDGLADTADALGGGQSRDRVFDILKDSRVGSYGALALVASVLLRVTSLASMQRGGEIALVLSHILGRASAVSILTSLPYVTPAEVSRSGGFAGRGWRDGALGWIATIVMLVAVTRQSSLSLFDAVFLLVLTVTLTLACGIYFRARVGGTTGDFLGAAEQVTECGVLLGCAVIFGTPE